MGSCGSREPSVEGSAATPSPKKLPKGVAGGTEKKASEPAESMVRWIYLLCEIISYRSVFFG
jgi:hypothetical protein